MRVYRNHHLDSTRWDAVPYRPDDIVITTPYKCGTTWTQHIVCSLIHGTNEPMFSDISPWVDARFRGPIEPIAAALAAQPHRRFIKSHLALDGTRWDDRVRFIVVGRDVRDVFMSFVNHYGSYTDAAFAMLNAGVDEPLPRYDGDLHGLWRNWITRGWFDWEPDGWPFWSHGHHWSTWWTARDRPNVLFVHFADLKADLAGEIARIASFLDIDADAATVARLAAATEFAAMRQTSLDHEGKTPHRSSFFEGGVATFMHKGANGQWRDVLTDEDLVLYKQWADELDPSLRDWLERG